jgi:tripartite-type tricarboxylate transporter receptor subunit TctC
VVTERVYPYHNFLQIALLFPSQIRELLIQSYFPHPKDLLFYNHLIFRQSQPFLTLSADSVKSCNQREFHESEWMKSKKERVHNNLKGKEKTMYQRKKFFSMILFSVLILFITVWTGQVGAQEKYPTRGIDIIVPFTPGGATDLVERVLASYLNRKWGVPINVINKPGGNTVPACLEAYNAKPDGYTLLGDSNPSSSMLPIVVRNLPFKIMDRTFIAIAAVTPMIIIVPSSSPIKSLKELEGEAKKGPETFTWTSLGGAGAQDFTSRQFLKAIGISDVSKTKPIMSQGGAQAVVLTAGGNVKMGVGTTSGAIPAISGGTVRPLAITSKTRYPDLPDVPTTTELGYPTVKCLFWIGVSGPPNLPTQILDKWDKALQEMLKEPEVISKLKNVGAVPFYHNPQEMKDYVMKETEEVAILWGLK